MTSEGESALSGGRAADAGLPALDDALNQVRDAMASATGLLPVAEAAALTIGEVLAANETTVTLIDGPEFWDIVDIRDDPTESPRFPDLRYPLASYPTGTERIMSAQGFFTSDADDSVMVEFGQQFPDVPAGSIMSVPIIAMDELHGEIFLIRRPGATPFGAADLALGTKLATFFGARLPALVTAYFEQRGQRRGSPSLPDLTEELEQPLD